MPKVSRPAQGVAPIIKPPRAAYKPAVAPHKVSLGKVSVPVPLPHQFRGGTDIADQTPKIVKR